jgi:hypothetical protein
MDIAAFGEVMRDVVVIEVAPLVWVTRFNGGQSAMKGDRRTP